MAGIYNGPARGGTRGGKDQFSWENVKADQDREYYLGHSVKALAGRWQKNKDVYWYTRDKDDDGAQERQDELRAVKQREEELMLEALGLKPKVPKQLGQATLDKGDMQKLLAKGTDGEEGGGGVFEDEAGPDRVKGLGFAAGARGMIQSGIQQDRLAGVGTAALQGAQGAGREHPARETGPSNAQQQQQGVQAAGAGGGAGLTAEQVKELKRLAKKEERRAAKRAKKEAKKAKKAAKKAKKKAGKEKRKKKGKSRSDSSGPSSSSESHESEDDSANLMDDGQPPQRSVAQQHGLSPRRGLGSRQTGEGLQRGRIEDSRSGRRENSRGGGIRSRSRPTLPPPLRHESRRSSRSPRRQHPGERDQRGVGQHERQHEDGRDGSGRYGEQRRGREYSPGRRAGQRDRGDRGRSRSRSRSRERGRGMGRQRHGSP